MRHHHEIKPGKPGELPDRIVCLVCDISAVYRTSDDRRWAERCYEWHACSSDVSHGAGEVEYFPPGLTPASWWKLALQLASAGKPTIVVCEYACRAMAALGLWQLVADGEWTLTQRDPRRAQRPGEEADRRWDGWACVDDPPTILQIMHSASGRKLTILDPRNWGWDSDCWPEDRYSRLLHIQYDVASLCDMLHDEHLSGLYPTASGIGWHTWRSRYNAGGVWVHDDEQALALEMAGLYSGRCECGYVGQVTVPVYHFDYRSMYPWCCTQYQQPMELLDYHQDGDHGCEPIYRTPHDCIADVSLATDSPIYPLRMDGHTIWPVGLYRTVLCGPELARAMEQHAVVEIHQWARYRMGQPLSQYVERLWELRIGPRGERSRNIERTIKRMLVSIVGRFSMRDRRWVRDQSQPATKPFGQWWLSMGPDASPVRCRSLGWRVEREVIGWAGDQACPAITAWVTAQGRMRLWDAIQVCGAGHVYYMDTDSIWCDHTAYQRLTDAGVLADTGLGSLRLVETCQSVEWIGLRHYIADGKRICAGLPASAREHGGRMRYERGVSPMQQLHLWTEDITPQGEMVDVTPSSGYSHGVVQSDGWVRPLRVRQL